MELQGLVQIALAQTGKRAFSGLRCLGKETFEEPPTGSRKPVHIWAPRGENLLF